MLQSGFYRTVTGGRHNLDNRMNLAGGYVDGKSRMLLNSTPMSNAERQRRFRARNPGYRNRYRYEPTKAQAILAETLADAEALVNGGKAEATPPATKAPAPREENRSKSN